MQTKLLIGGRLVAGEGPVEQVLDAATGLSIAAIAAASTAQVRSNVSSRLAVMPLGTRVDASASRIATTSVK